MASSNIGTKFFDYIYDRAKEKRTTFGEELLTAYAEDFPDAPKQSARIAKELIQNVLKWIESHSIPDEKPDKGWGHWILDIAGDHVAPTPTQQFEELLLSLDDLSEENQEFQRFLNQIEPLGKDLAQAQSDGVRIMTMGGSKGLAVPAVIIAGVDVGLVPRPDGPPSEERRILYVAMTRAKEYLYCTWAKRRRGRTSWLGAASKERRVHSTFLDGGPVDSQDGERFLRDHF